MKRLSLFHKIYTLLHKNMMTSNSASVVLVKAKFLYTPLLQESQTHVFKWFKNFETILHEH